jgi:simple sugar transport system ATP-binding protein
VSAAPLPPRLELRGISKSFPGVLANDDVSLAVAPGEIHAIVGENGAGKSTLVKIIYGVLAAESGELRWDGRPVAIASPRDARVLGIGMVFQHFSLFEALSVLDNIALGLDEALDRKALAARVTAILSSYSLPLDLGRTVSTLSVGERQRIEIVRCLLARPKLLIMDEPTSVLTPQEAARLFALLRQLAAEGCSVLYISHKLDEVRALCHRATILRGGRVVASVDPRAATAHKLAELMIGAELARVERPAAAREPRPGEPRLAVRGLSLPRSGPFSTELRDIAFEVAPGEILGIAGVAGNGQSELLLALAGERLAAVPGAVLLEGRSIGRLGPAARRRLGLCAVPEERNGHAAVPDLSLAENALLTARHRLPLVRAGVLRLGAARRFAAGIIGRFAVKATGPGAAARSLSGGNLQKFVVGREIGQAPGILVVSQPTWGVDAGAAAAIHQALADLAAKGSAIVIVSQDLEELLALSDRLAILNEGRLSAPWRQGARASTRSGS